LKPINSSVLDVIVIGAGHAGLSISYYLKENHYDHLVFEQGKIGNSWSRQRWDSFKLNTPNKFNLLPSQESIFLDDEGFCTASEFLSSLDEYIRKYQLPVHEGSKVLSVEKLSGSGDFSVLVSNNGMVGYYKCKQIVVASGIQNIKNVPSFSKNISQGVLQLHTSEYRNPASLPDGAVIVVGSAQSGVQIAEDLLAGGRKVFISTSRVGRFPRRYRGKDIVEWLSITGFFDMKTTDVSDPGILSMRQPQISTTGLNGHTLSLQSLAQNGAVILGKIENADAGTIYLQPNAADHVRFADESSMKTKKMIDEFIQKTGLTAPQPEEDPDDHPDKDASCASSLPSLNLSENNITTIIWATGFTGDFSYLKFPVLNNFGIVQHYNGISEIAGIYFLGLPWLRKRNSGIIMGIKEDAEFIANRLLGRMYNVL
jgi:putative flavoprotein involved in K+ transport